jgi:hypothetical protein
MNLMTCGRGLFQLLIGLLACASCGDHDSAPDERNASGGEPSGSAGAPAGKADSPGIAGSQSGNATGGSGSEGGAPATGGTAGGSGAGCYGDATRWASITAAQPECQTANDCCVVVNGCLSEGRVVGVADFETAQAAWPFCDADCNDCIPPAIIVACDGGKCVGTIDPEGLDDGTSHCGDTAPMGPEPSQSFSCQ